MKLLVRWVMLAISFWVATLVIPGIKVHGHAKTYLWVALLFGLINSIIGSLLKVLTFPALFLTLGLFSFVINALMLELTAHWSKSLTLSNFWSALGAALLISVVASILNRTFNQAVKR
jgi:putative membrane protein